MTVPPSTWRLVADRMADDETFIPCSDPVRWLAVHQRMLDGPTEEERMSIERERLKAEASRVATMIRLRKRHEELVRRTDSSVVAALLAQHAPYEIGDQDQGEKVYQECHGCPTWYDHGDDFGGAGEQHHECPCPTWQTISDATP